MKTRVLVTLGFLALFVGACAQALPPFAPGGHNVGYLFINDVQVTATPAELNIMDGVTATATEINKLDGVTSSTAELNIVDGVTVDAAALNTIDDYAVAVGSMTFAAAAGTTCRVTITAVDAGGSAVTGVEHLLHVWLSDDAEGEGVTATAPDALAVQSGEGTDLTELVADKLILAVTKDGAGTYTLEIQDDTQDAYYVAVSLGGKVFVSRQLVAGDYVP